jgi:tetratricopeptide (TPR) repeat protein
VIFADEMIARAEVLAKTDEAGALALADQIAAQYPDDFRVWSLLAYLRALRSDYEAAVSALSRAIDLEQREPCLFFDRGRYELQLGNWVAAERDLSTGLELCDFHQDDYYRQTLHFFRAEARIRLGRNQDALADLGRVEEGFKFWTYRLATKAMLVAECRSD